MVLTVIKRYLSLYFILLLIIPTQELFPGSIASASGLAVYPAGLLIQSVTPGEVYDISEVSGVTLNITNKDSIPHTYIISVHRPSAVGTKKWIDGYHEIPDPSWFRPEEEEVWIEANETAKIKMSIEIPDEERFYNQSWSVCLWVRGKAEQGSMVALAVAPRFEIETAPKEGLKTRPDGMIAFEPHVIVMEDLLSGSRRAAKVRLYNNDTKRHYYTMVPKIYPKDPEKNQIPITPGYRWIPDPRWISPDEMKVSVGPEGDAQISFSVYVPEDQACMNQKWEAILFCESEEGRSGFIRLHIETAKGRQLSADPDGLR